MAKHTRELWEVLLAALKANWQHTDDKGQIFYCNCPVNSRLFGQLMTDCSRDADERHCSACQQARAAIAEAEAE